MQTTTTRPDATQVRAQMHAMWQGVAPAWGEHADYVDRRAADLSRHLLDEVELRPGDRVLELACGAGGLGLAAAERMAGDGEVTLSDVAPGMAETAERRARERGLTNVRSRVLDIEAIDEADGSYDVVLCRDGLQFAADPAQGVREMARVLRPGGRVGLATWASPQQNPWLSTLMGAFAAETGRQVPRPGMPGPFALDDPERLAAMLHDAGLTASVTERPVAMRVGSFNEWWERTTALAGPVRGLLAKLPDETVASVRVRAEQAVQRYATADGFELPGVALVAVGRRG